MESRHLSASAFAPRHEPLAVTTAMTSSPPQAVTYGAPQTSGMVQVVTPAMPQYAPATQRGLPISTVPRIVAPAAGSVSAPVATAINGTAFVPTVINGTPGGSVNLSVLTPRVASHVPTPRMSGAISMPCFTPPVPSMPAAAAPVGGLAHSSPPVDPGLEPAPPQSLTQGIPDPNSVERQKATYAKDLDSQLTQGIEVLNAQLKQQTEYLYAVGEQQKRQYGLQIDQQIKKQEMQLAQQHNEQVLMLQRAAQQQKSALEHQANALVLEYTQKKATEDLLHQQYQFKKNHHETQMKYNEELRSLQVQQQIAFDQVQNQHKQIAQQVHQSAHQAAQAHMTAAQALHTSAIHHSQVAQIPGTPGVPIGVPMTTGSISRVPA